MPRPREYDEDRVSTQVRLPKQLHAWLQAHATERGVSLNRLIEQILTRFSRRN